MTACKIKERASDRDVENIVERFLPITAVEKCFVACWLESFSVVGHNMKFNNCTTNITKFGVADKRWTIQP